MPAIAQAAVAPTTATIAARGGSKWLVYGLVAGVVSLLAVVAALVALRPRPADVASQGPAMSPTVEKPATEATPSRKPPSVAHKTVSPAQSEAAVSAALTAAKLAALEGSDLTEKVDAVAFLVEEGKPEVRPATLAAFFELWQEPQAGPAFQANGARLRNAWRKMVKSLKEEEQSLVAGTLLKNLQNGSLEDSMRSEALNSMNYLGEHGKAAVPLAYHYIGGGSTNVQVLARAMDLLKQHDGRGSLHVAEINLLKHFDQGVRLAAAQAIASNAVPTDKGRFLGSMHRIYTTETNYQVRVTGGLVLRTFMGEEAAFNLFKKDADKASGGLKNAALILMGNFGERGIPVLRAHILEGEHAWACLEAIRKVGPAAISLLPEVKQLQKNPHEGLRTLANRTYETLTKVGN